MRIVQRSLNENDKVADAVPGELEDLSFLSLADAAVNHLQGIPSA